MDDIVETVSQKIRAKLPELGIWDNVAKELAIDAIAALAHAPLDEKALNAAFNIPIYQGRELNISEAIRAYLTALKEATCRT